MANHLETFLLHAHETQIDSAMTRVKNGLIFKQYTPPGVTYVYDNNGDATAHAGAIACGLMTSKAIQIYCFRSGSTGFSVTIEQKVHEMMPFTEIWTGTYTAVGANNDWIPIGERAYETRVGVRLLGGIADANDIITIGFNFSG